MSWLAISKKDQPTISTTIYGLHTYCLKIEVLRNLHRERVWPLGLPATRKHCSSATVGLRLIATIDKQPVFWRSRSGVLGTHRGCQGRHDDKSTGEHNATDLSTPCLGSCVPKIITIGSFFDTVFTFRKQNVDVFETQCSFKGLEHYVTRSCKILSRNITYYVWLCISLGLIIII